jgi:hypothetical protein
MPAGAPSASATLTTAPLSRPTWARLASSASAPPHKAGEAGKGADQRCAPVAASNAANCPPRVATIRRAPSCVKRGAGAPRTSAARHSSRRVAASHSLSSPAASTLAANRPSAEAATP